MRKVLLISIAAVALTACGRAQAIDPEAKTAIVPMDINKPVDLTQLSILELTKVENKCILSDSCSGSEASTIDAEWHRRGWCAYDATGRRKPHCTHKELVDDTTQIVQEMNQSFIAMTSSCDNGDQDGCSALPDIKRSISAECSTVEGVCD